MQFSTAFIASAIVAGAAAQSSFATVQTNVQNIQTSVARLLASLQKTQGTNYGEALNINSAANQLNRDIQTANTNAQGVSSVTVAQANTLLTILRSTYPNVTASTQRLIALQPNFQRIGVAGIAKSSINNIAASTRTFGATLVSKAPSAVKASASSLASQYNAALASAAAAYA
ncbi:hypothetical protein V8E36_006193 [Tilletia maclaganii]